MTSSENDVMEMEWSLVMDSGNHECFGEERLEFRHFA